MARLDSVLSVFRKSPLFSGIPEETLVRLLKDFPIKSYKKGEVVIQQNKPCSNAFLLIEGKVKIYCENKAGIKSTVLYHSPPFLFGVIELLEDFHYTASAVTLEPCKMIVLNRNEYISLLHSNHQFCYNIIKLLSWLLYQAGEDRRVRFFGQVEHLLARAVCALAQLEGEKHRDGVRITRKVSKTELASLLGVSRKSITSAFAQLEQKNLVSMDGTRIFIPSVNNLQSESMKL